MPTWLRFSSIFPPFSEPWGLLGGSWGFLGRLGGVLGASWAVLGHLKASWSQEGEKNGFHKNPSSLRRTQSDPFPPPDPLLIRKQNSLPAQERPARSYLAKRFPSSADLFGVCERSSLLRFRFRFFASRSLPLFRRSLSLPPFSRFAVAFAFASISRGVVVGGVAPL